MRYPLFPSSSSPPSALGVTDDSGQLPELSATINASRGKSRPLAHSDATRLPACAASHFAL